MQWMSNNAVAAYGLCAIMLAFAVFLRLRCGSWSNPSVVFALFWGMMTLMPINFVPELQPSLMAIGYITAAVIAFGAPLLLFQWHGPLAAVAGRKSTNSPFLSGNEAVLLLLVAQAGVVGCMMANVAHQGFSLRDFLFDPFAIGCQYLGYRYSGAVKPYPLSQVATILNYVVAALAGLIVVHRPNVLLGAGVVLLTIIPSLYCIAVYADKGTIFLTLAFFYGAVVVGRIQRGSTALLTWKAVLAAPLILVIVASAIGLAMANRISEVCDDRQMSKLSDQLITSIQSNEAEVNQASPSVEASAPPIVETPAQQMGGKLRFYVRSYAFGHLFAFSSWFDHRLAGGATLPDQPQTDLAFKPQWNSPDQPLLYRNPARPTYGFWTFMAIGKYVNPRYFQALPDGYFEEYFLRPGVIQTNIYTFFRGLIYDFSVPGSLLFLAACGWTFNFLYRKLMLTPQSPLPQTLYIFFAGYLYTSYIISLLIWSSVIASSIGTFVLLTIISYLDRSGGSVRYLLSGRGIPSGNSEGPSWEERGRERR